MEHQAVCAVILAAGSSSRMGKTKQLLKLGDKPILEIVIDQVIKQTFDQILVVIGHEAEKIKTEIPLQTNQVQWVVNKQYHLGQSTSFLTAFCHIKPTINSVMFFLGDQPFLKDDTIGRVLTKGWDMYKNERSPFVVQPYCQQSPGHPTYWGNFRTLDLSVVSGDEGGKSLFPYVKKERLMVEDREIYFDIDTPDDYIKALRKRNSK
jgi:molybdenum cofactor cytidylyltransferase